MKPYTILIILIIAILHQLNAIEATYYSGELTGRPMANTDPYDPTGYTCASWDYDLGTVLCVRHQDKAVLVTVTDRHDYKTDIDLSWVAFCDLIGDWSGEGRIHVKITELKD